MERLDEGDLKYLIDHVFLPPKLPQKYDAETPRRDSLLLDYVAFTSRGFLSSLSTHIEMDAPKYLKVWRIIFKMLVTMGTFYNEGGIVRTKLQAALERMEVDDVLPVFVEAQNAAIIFRKFDLHKLTFEAFEVSPPSNVVIGAAGKIGMRFPTNPRLPFPADKAVLSTLANAIAHLSTSLMEEAMPTSRKGGEDHYEIRDTASPRFITEALAGVIRATPPTTPSAVDTMYIHKRLDDQVLWKSALKPWRRSSIWLVIRVAMQTTLTEWGAQVGQDYKAFQAFLMASLLERGLVGDSSRFPCDLLDSMRAKLVRRLCKIGALVDDFTLPTLRVVADTVRHTSRALEQRWKEVRELHESTVQWEPLSQEAVATKTTLEFSFPQSRTFLLDLIRRHDSPAAVTTDFDCWVFEASLKRALPLQAMLSSSHMPSISDDDVQSSLQDFELWVEIHLKQWEGSPLRTEVDCVNLSSAITKYREKATVHYKDAPERVSLMHLCILELWVALDRICIKWCPLLREYSPEIAQNVADPLVLPYYSQMKRLEDVRLYLGHRHQYAQIHGGRSVFRQVNTEKSFHNLFFNLLEAAPLLALEKKIQADATRQKAATIAQLEQSNERHRSLMEQAQAQSCLYAEVYSLHGPRWRHRPKKCPKCQLQRTARALTVIPFEEPLPESSLWARPIVFELMCPLRFAIWRDVTTTIILSVLAVQPESHAELYPLRTYAPLKNYFVNPYPGCRISFASSTKSLQKSHYGAPCQVPATEGHVLFAHKGTFNVFDAVANESADNGSDETLRSTCTFRVDGLYAPLQSFVNDTRHAPNSVIATVSKAPIGLSLSEYITFGQLRAGNRIQWRNVMKAIKMQTLPFSEPAVFALVVQAIWQAGPVGNDSGSQFLYREAHVDLLDESFGMQISEELLRTVKSLGDNWKQVNLLAILVVVALRVHAFTPHLSVQLSLQHVLCEVRIISMSWIESLATCSKISVAEKDSEKPEDNRAQAMANVAVVLRASFDVECNEYTGVFRSSKDAVMYIYAAILVSAVHIRSFSSSLKLLASRHHRVSLRVEPHLIRACLSDSSIVRDVVSLAWPEFSTGNQWTALSSCRNHWWTSHRVNRKPLSSLFLHINVLDGTFLINGKAFHQLPAEYGSHPVYINLFKDHVFRAVQQSEIGGMQYQSRYGDHKVHFSMIGKRLLILRGEDTAIQEYIPVENIQADLPFIFSSGHCFWYSRETHSISIQPRSEAWARASDRYWTVDLQSYKRRFVGRVTKTTIACFTTLVASNSEIHRLLAKTLAPLEPDPRGLVVTTHESGTMQVDGTVQEDDATISIHLPRHGLRFALQQNELQCLSVPGYVVDANLSGVGCLIGLKSILNLRRSDFRQPGRKIIVPKGLMVLSAGHCGHAAISIDLGDSKGYFLYDVDDLVGRLVGTRTIESDLYLVKLHAFTSSSLADPLTQRTGTSEALDRLSGASSLSFFSVSKESRAYLDDIATLTPLRTFYPAHLQVMESVAWTKYLPTSAQRPEFRSRVMDVLVSWREMEPFLQAGNLADGLEDVEGMEHLTYRAAHRDWIHSSSIVPDGYAVDYFYMVRDSLADSKSRQREGAVFQAVGLTSGTFTGIPPCKNLQYNMLQWNKVTGIQRWDWESIEDWLETPASAPIANTWCTFYDLCCRLKSSRFEASVALAFQCFRGVPLELIASFAAVIHNPQFSSSPLSCPAFDVLELASGSTFNREYIRNLVKPHELPFRQSDEYDTRPLPMESENSRLVRAQKLYRSALEEECGNLIDELNDCWPEPPSRPLGINLRLLKPLAEILEDTIRPLLNSWARNRDFLSRIQLIQGETNKAQVSENSYSEYSPYHSPPPARTAKSFTITLEGLMSERTPDLVYALTMEQLPISSGKRSDHEEPEILLPLLQRLQACAENVLQQNYVKNLGDSLNAYKSYFLQSSSNSPRNLDRKFSESLRSISAEHSRLYFEQARQCLRPHTAVSQLMQIAGIWPTVTTHTLLQGLSFKRRRNLSPSWVRLLVGYAVSIHDVRRMGRLLLLGQTGMSAALESELQYTRVWDPSEHPDWLLVEIDADISVRPVQAAIAKEMLMPEGGENAVMQLNMGEGKSSVIVPIVAASAATGSTLCRVVVLGPQMKQQFQILRQTLTGLCDRRVIYLPFHRKLQLDAPAISRIHRFLRISAMDGAVWICEPEHLMSLKLLALDQAVHAGIREFISVYAWLHENTKDLLDESDEILHTRQQVIYTVGLQQPLDAAPARWQIAQKLLGLLATYLINDPRSQDSSSFLIGTKPNPATFPTVRIQSVAARQHLLRLMEESLHNHDWPLPPHMNHLIANFVTSPNPSKDLTHVIRSYCSKEDERVMQIILILRGLIGGDILMHSLKEKRWRVQYGLDLQRSKLAIPFRAKDLPSTRSEFGHPDITIVLTCLSYYYAGLDLQMVRCVLQSLLTSDAPELTYADWLKPCWDVVPKSLRSIQGLDLQDKNLLRDQIYPLLRKNKAVIDYYLHVFIFPFHAQEFPFKMSTSGWDIAIPKPTPTTGFSGTNDGRLLLPVTVAQTDREAQLHTNAKVLSHILRKENSQVVHHPNFLDSVKFLEKIRRLSPVPNVILDVGAQILDLANIEFVQHWLATYKDDSTIKAAVFFDEGNNLLVLTSDGATQPFIGSPYSSRLDQCLVYLDEAHTRGTDLRIPLNSRAAVTLGPKLNKDKLVQGCMRMRKLGEGHSLVFIASDEVTSIIRKATGSQHDTVTSEDVIFWSVKETWHQLQADLPAWVLQGHSFLRREAAWKDVFRGILTSSKDIKDKFCEAEARTLEKLYGSQSSEAAHWIWQHHSIDSKDGLVRKIVQRCQDFNAFAIRDAGVHEEMEIELVHEKEVERELERAPDAGSAQHDLHANVVRFVNTGDTSFCRSEGFHTAAKAFSGTSLMVPKEFNQVLSNIVVTNDFWRTIQLPFSQFAGCMDKFIRPVDWVVTVGTPSTALMVLFSPYEVNQLLPKFRTSTKVTLHMFTPQTNFAIPSLEDLNFLSLPSTSSTSPLPRPLAIQLNLFSGSLYFRDHRTYLDVCRTLRLYFEHLPGHLAKPEIINANFFVLDPTARLKLGMTRLGFEEDALPFFRNMIQMRRFGRGFGPSHIGKILNGTRLKDSDFVGGVIKEREDVDMLQE